MKHKNFVGYVLADAARVKMYDKTRFSAPIRKTLLLLLQDAVHFVANTELKTNFGPDNVIQEIAHNFSFEYVDANGIPTVTLVVSYSVFKSLLVFYANPEDHADLIREYFPIEDDGLLVWSFIYSRKQKLWNIWWSGHHVALPIRADSSEGNVNVPITGVLLGEVGTQLVEMIKAAPNFKEPFALEHADVYHALFMLHCITDGHNAEVEAKAAPRSPLVKTKPACCPKHFWLRPVEQDD